MQKIVVFILLAAIVTFCSLPEPIHSDFEGKFIYSIKYSDTLHTLNDSAAYYVVYAKDSMLRVDNFTPIGKQTFIKHIPKNKAYILMNLAGNKVAIQTHTDTVEQNNYYKYEYQSGSEKIAGIKAKHIKVIDLELDTTLIMSYYPKISPKYSTALNDMPGLPVKYYLFTDGGWTTYQLVSIEEKPLDIDLFGIPSDYEIISFDEFTKRIDDK